jgi:hypothetical protein
MIRLTSNQVPPLQGKLLRQIIVRIFTFERRRSYHESYNPQQQKYFLALNVHFLL